ncbi:Protein kinase domain [Trinorchestia longiramus]|nr:Protein kinase domain [Trinorchestia longiramus]
MDSTRSGSPPLMSRSVASSANRPHRSYERPPPVEDACLRKERTELRRKRTIKEVRRRPLPHWSYESLEGTCVSEWLLWTGELVWGVWTWAVRMAGGVVGELVRVVVPPRTHPRQQYVSRAYSPRGHLYSHNKNLLDERLRERVTYPRDAVADAEQSIPLLDNRRSSLPTTCKRGFIKSPQRSEPHRESFNRPAASLSDTNAVATRTSYTNPHEDSVVCSKAGSSEVLRCANPSSSLHSSPVTSCERQAKCDQSQTNVDHDSLSVTSFKMEDKVPFIDEGTEAGDESLNLNADQVLEAMRGFTSVQCEMMKAIREAKQVSTTLTKCKKSRDRCHSVSSMASGESLPSVSSLEKFLASSRCTSTVSSLPSSPVSSRNASVSSGTTKCDTDDSTPYGEDKSLFDDVIEKSIVESLDTLDVSDIEDASLIPLKSIQPEGVVQMREKKSHAVQRPWSFDVSFLKESSAPMKKMYAYQPRKLSNVETLINESETSANMLHLRPNTLKLKFFNDLQTRSDDHQVIFRKNLNFIPPVDEVTPKFSSEAMTSENMKQLEPENYLVFDKWLKESEYCNKPVLDNTSLLSNDATPVTPVDISIFLTRPDAVGHDHSGDTTSVDYESLATSCEYESMEESFSSLDDRLLTVKSVRESSSSNDGRTWHDISVSDCEENVAITPLSSPSPVSEIPPKIDITSLKGEIMALKREIFARKGGVVPTPENQENTAIADKSFVSSVEDIGSLRNEISALKQDFLSLLDDNAKSSLKNACKKSKYKYSGKAVSIDSVNDIFKPKSTCLDRISSLDQKSVSDDDDGLFFSCKQSKWKFPDKFDSDSEEQPSEVWFQTPNVKSTHGFLAKSKLDAYEMMSRGVPGMVPQTAVASSLPLRQQVPQSALMAPSVPTHEPFCPTTLRRLTEMLQANSSDSEDQSSLSDTENSQYDSRRDSSDDGFASDDSDCEDVELPCSVERVLYGLQASPFVLSDHRTDIRDRDVEEEEEEEEVLGSDDEEQEDSKDYCKGGYHPVMIGDLFYNRYHVIRKLGWGHFSTVWLCWDMQAKRFVALKVVKSASHYTETALDEIKLLKCVREADETDPKRDKTVQLLDDFKITGVNGTHVCMVFEVLGHNLLKFIIRSNYQGIPLANVKNITRQVLEALDYLHTRCQIIHTDIKPENILMCVDDIYIRKLAYEATQWQKMGLKLPGSLVSTAPKHFNQPDPNAKISKTKRKKIKKKAKVKQALLEKQIKDLEELEERETRLALATCSLTDGASPNHESLTGTSNGDCSAAAVGEVGPQGTSTNCSEDSNGTKPVPSEDRPPKASVKIIMNDEEPVRNDCSEDHDDESSDHPMLRSNLYKGANNASFDETAQQKLEHRKSLAEMCEADVTPGGAVGLNLDPLMNGHNPGAARPHLGRSESEISPDLRIAHDQHVEGAAADAAVGGLADLEGGDKVSSGDPLASSAAGMRRVASCPDHKALETMPDPVTEVCDLQVKIADLGNACWVDHHFTEDIQTRQYRCLEVLLGAGYGTPADIWSTASMSFELATGDYLFEPHSGAEYSRDEDHLAHIIELLGEIPRPIALSGKYSREFFDMKGELRHISKLRPWGLYEVLTEKYEWPDEEARAFTDFLLPMLEFDPNKRATAAECLKHPWLNS